MLTAAGVVLALALAITSQSLWIDELSTALLARQQSWGDLMNALGSLGSEAQMPFFAVWIWVWGHVAGTSEWGLRAANLPWAVLAVAAFVHLLRSWRCHPLAGGVLLSPFLLYYMNEARPYVMGFAGATLALAATERLIQGEHPGGRGARGGALVGLAISLGASLLNAALLVALAVYAALRIRTATPQRPAWARTFGGLLSTYRGLVFTAALMLAAFLTHDVLMMLAGHGGQKTGLSTANVVFAIYEMLGFGGLGAPRTVLRGLAGSRLILHYGVWLACGIAAWLAWAWAVSRPAVRPGNAFRPLVLAALAGVLALLVAAGVMRASLWGRHFMALYPFVLAALALLLSELIRNRRGPVRLAAVLLLAVFVLSAARQRVLPEYGKDPLREGVAALRDLQAADPARPVVFLAYPLAIWYYDGTPHLEIVEGWSADRIRDWNAQHAEYLLFMNRADILDTTGLWRKMLTPSQATALWQRGNVTIHRIRTDTGGSPIHE